MARRELEVDGMPLAGVILRPPTAAAGIARLELLETLGYRSGFVTHVNEHDSLTILAAAAIRTRAIELGTAVVPIYSRDPGAMAQTAATIGELSEDRMVIGLGLSHAVVAENWYGARIEHPVAEMREYVARFRHALEGTEIEGVGDRWGGAMPLSGVRSPRLRIFLGALSPGMLRAAGEIADGVLLWSCGPEYIRSTVVPAIKEGCERADRSFEDFAIVPAIPTAVTDEPARLRRALARQSLHNLRLPFYRRVLERSGFSSDLGLVKEANGIGEVYSPVNDEVLDQLANGETVRSLGAIGGPSDVLAKLAEFSAAGATLGAVSPILIKRFEEEVTDLAASAAGTSRSR